MTRSLYSVSKMFNSTVRIQIVAALSVESLTFKQLGKICQVSAGHLQNHIKVLENHGYLTSTVDRIDGTKQTNYYLTELAEKDFAAFMGILTQTLKPRLKEKEVNEAEKEDSKPSKKVKMQLEG